MKDPFSITGLATPMTRKVFTDVSQSLCFTAQANAGAVDNPEENISLAPLVDALLVYLNKGKFVEKTLWKV